MNPASPTGPRPLTPAVRAGDFLFVSGQASTDPETGAFIAGTFEEEFRRTMDNLGRVLTVYGATLADVVRVTGYVRDEDDLVLYNQLYAASWPEPFPARTTIAMGFRFLKIEIDCIAYLGLRER